MRAYKKNKIKGNNQNLKKVNLSSKESKEEFCDEDSRNNSENDIDYKNSPKNSYINDSDDDNEFSFDKKKIKIDNPFINNNINRFTSLNNNRNLRKSINFRELLKSVNYSPFKRDSIIHNFSKLNKNSILHSSRNTISYQEKPHYLSLSYILSNKKSINNYNNINSIGNINNSNNKIINAKIIQKWWRKRKQYFDNKNNQIIKIQSVWRGGCVREEIHNIIYLCYNCQEFYNILLKVLSHHIRLFVWNILFARILKLRKIYNRYKLKALFQRWKCIYKLLAIKTQIKKTKINIINIKDLYNNKNNSIKNKLLNDKNVPLNFKFDNILKSLFINSIYAKIRLNKLREVFDFIKLYNRPNMIKMSNQYKNSNQEKDNNYLKKFFFFKWLNQIKKININKIKEKCLKYVIMTHSIKNNFNLLYKYFSLWKLLKDDYFNSINNIKKQENKNKIKSLIIITETKKVNLNIIFLRELIRKWRFYVFAKKMAKNKMIKMYEVMQKTYFKMSQDMYDFNKVNEEQYNILNNDNNEDEKNFIEHINNLYNSKINQNFKFKYNNKGVFK